MQAADLINPVETLFSPEAFARHVWRADVSPDQKRLFEALSTHRYVALRKGHSTGGTWAICAYLLQQMAVHPAIKIIVTGPTWDTVTLVSFGQLADLVRTARGRYAYPDPTEAFLDMTQPGGPARWIAGLSTTDVNRFSGHKSSRLIVWMTEAAGVNAGSWSATDGLTASGDVQVIAESQPHSARGPFFDACHGRGSPYHTVHMDCFTSPNIAGYTEADVRAMEHDDPRLDVIRHPHLVRLRWVWERMAKLTPAEWSAKVRGCFPDEDAHALFPLSLLYGARDRVANPWAGQVTAGLDIAGRGRDATVLIIEGGGAILAMHRWREDDPRGAVLAALAPWRDRLSACRADSGGLGYNFCLHLSDHGIPVAQVNFGSAARNPVRFSNRRAEMYYGLRDRLAAGEVSGLTGPLGEAAISQLAAITQAPTPAGKEALTSKAKMRASGVESPDEADALVLALAGGPAVDERAILRSVLDSGSRIASGFGADASSRSDRWSKL